MEGLVKSHAQKIEMYDASSDRRAPEVPGIVSPTGVGIQPLAAGDYMIYLRLILAGFTLKKARINGGAFFPMPWIHRNCFTDCDTCYNNGNYQPILNAHCQNAAFQLELFFQNDSNPNQWGRTAHAVNPDCRYSGQVECVT